ncbi:biotin biosynthesis protein BioC [Ewingella americana]|uniref:Biotin biosynthesis protein BioC n=1 Tax=Ewingella americana TaxID=41202 RepID=A0A377TGW3_9GAMM|nr:biotin biosynthesis protein BioC [Ewingella americana]
MGLSAELAAKVHFSQGDACNLKPQKEPYDLVLASNLIDRLREPKRFLRDVVTMIRPGGILMLSSPYTWLEEFTAEGELAGRRA